MNNLAFDTHSAVKQLTTSGMPEKQAETVVETLRKSREFDISHLATKAGLNEVKNELKADIAALEASTKSDLNEVKNNIAALAVSTKSDLNKVKSEFKADIAALESRIIKWIVPLMLGQTALITALVKLL